MSRRFASTEIGPKLSEVLLSCCVVVLPFPSLLIKGFRYATTRRSSPSICVFTRRPPTQVNVSSIYVNQCFVIVVSIVPTTSAFLSLCDPFAKYVVGQQCDMLLCCHPSPSDDLRKMTTLRMIFRHISRM